MRLKLYRGKWAAIWTDQDGKVRRRSLRTSDRAIADRRLRDQRPETPGDTVGDAVDLYLAEKKKAGARSYGSMVTASKPTLRFFGSYRPDQLTRELCREYANGRTRAGVSDGTIIKDLGVLKAALGFVHGKTYGGATFEFPHAPPPRERYITRAEHQLLVSACDLPHIRLFVILAWATAGRHSAILELEWSQVDFGREQIRLSKASGRRKGRATVPMTQQAKVALQAAYESRTCDYVIEWGGQPIKSVSTAFEKAAKKAGLEDVTPHILRHSAAVALVEAGVSMVEIAAILGHTNPATTFKNYIKFSPGHLKKAMKALE